jgi:hypothetical protein
MRNVYTINLEAMKGRDHSQDVDIDGRIWILNLLSLRVQPTVVWSMGIDCWALRS